MTDHACSGVMCRLCDTRGIAMSDREGYVVPVPDSLKGPRDGLTFAPERDTDRLNRQAQLVFRVVSDGEWHTLGDIAAKTDQPEASVSARLRDLRKERFGSHVIARRYLRDGLWEYRWEGQP